MRGSVEEKAPLRYVPPSNAPGNSYWKEPSLRYLSLLFERDISQQLLTKPICNPEDQDTSARRGIVTGYYDNSGTNRLFHSFTALEIPLRQFLLKM
jgi:hypothetical protein